MILRRERPVEPPWKVRFDGAVRLIEQRSSSSQRRDSHIGERLDRDEEKHKDRPKERSKDRDRDGKKKKRKTSKKSHLADAFGDVLEEVLDL